jgi:type VI protein secretion system component Hcp
MTGRKLVRSAAWAPLAVLVWVLASTPAEADDAIFAVFANPADGALAVKGAPADADMARRGALELESVAFGIENSLVIDPEQGALGPGRPRFKTLTMTLPLGPGVPALLQTSAAGGHYGDVTLHFRDDDAPVDHATLSLKMVALSAVEISAPADESPRASVDLAFGSMKLEVFPEDAGGQPAQQPEVGQWNVMTGTADFSTVPKP